MIFNLSDQFLCWKYPGEAAYTLKLSFKRAKISYAHFKILEMKALEEAELQWVHYAIIRK